MSEYLRKERSRKQLPDEEPGKGIVHTLSHLRKLFVIQWDTFTS